MKDHEALEKQSKIQKKNLSIFISIAAVSAAAAVTGAILMGDPSRKTAVILVGAVIAVVAFVKLRIFEFFKPKVITGAVTDINVFVTHIKRNLSNIPGERYRGYDAPFVKYMIRTENGKVHIKTFPYIPEYDKIQKDDTLSFFRFIDSPVVHKDYI